MRGRLGMDRDGDKVRPRAGLYRLQRFTRHPVQADEMV